MADEVRAPRAGAPLTAPAAPRLAPLSAAVVASAPGWLRGALRRSLGRAGAEAFLAAGPVPPPGGLCLAPGEDRDAWVETLRRAAPDATIEPGRVSPAAILVRGAGDVRRLPGAGTAWIGQEEGAQAIMLALGAAPGETVLDACAGRGNKSWWLARSGIAVDAADIHPSKLVQAAAAGARATYAVDWTVGTGDVPEGYDRALVDAPCSGIGTLRRRPEIALRRQVGDLERLADLQVAIVRRVATRVRDGGSLLYAVCSVLREEGEAVVDRLAASGSGVTLEPGTTFRLLPHVHGTDGYFAAMFVIRR
jgi:16S rRNA (cytosine967-C5)-methyltransferase